MYLLFMGEGGVAQSNSLLFRWKAHPPSADFLHTLPAWSSIGRAPSRSTGWLVAEIPTREIVQIYSPYKDPMGRLVYLPIHLLAKINEM